MILSDYSIAERLDNSELVKRPHLIGDEQIQPASLDVRLGDGFIVPTTGAEFSCERNLTLETNERLLAHTEEMVDLPNDLAAQLAGRSTIGRKGVIVHKTAGWIDPGFEGQVTLELFNLSKDPVTLGIGERVAQLVFLQLDQDSSGYDGQYQRQMGATEAGQ